MASLVHSLRLFSSWKVDNSKGYKIILFVSYAVIFDAKKLLWVTDFSILNINLQLNLRIFDEGILWLMMCCWPVSCFHGWLASFKEGLHVSRDGVVHRTHIHNIISWTTMYSYSTHTLLVCEADQPQWRIVCFGFLWWCHECGFNTNLNC